MPNDDNVVHIRDKLKQGLGSSATDERSSDFGGGGGNDEPPDMTELDSRLSKLEGAYDSLKVVRPMTLAVVSLVLAVMVFGFAFVGTQLVSLSTQIARQLGRQARSELR
jgi:hypothetical protein